MLLLAAGVPRHGWWSGVLSPQGFDATSRAGVSNPCGHQGRIRLRPYNRSHPEHLRRTPCAPALMPFILSHQVLDEVLQKHRIKSNDLAGIDRLFGGADGYYWYHTMRHMCPRTKIMVWGSQEEMRAALQDHENETAAEDEVKPQLLKDAHLAAIAQLLAVPG